MKNLFQLIMILASIEGFSQSWQWGIGEHIEAEGTSICADPSGNIIWTGEIMEFTNCSSCLYTIGTSTLSNFGNRPAVIKYDASGNYLWHLISNASGTANITKSATDQNGNIFITGIFAGTLSIGSATIVAGILPDLDPYVAKISASGTLLWLRRGTGSGVDESFSVCADQQGNCIISGWFDSPTLAFGSTTLTAPSSAPLFLVKYDPSGNVLWAATNNGAAYSVCTDQNNNVFIAGSFDSTSVFGTSTITSTSFSDFFIAKYNSAGVAQWAMAGQSSPCLNCYSGGVNVKTDGLGNLYGYGQFSSITFTVGNTTFTNSSVSNTNSPNSDLFLVKLDNNGTLLWSAKFGSTSSEIPYGLAADNSGAYVAGKPGSSITFSNITLATPPAATEPGVFIAKYDALSGTPLYAAYLKAGGDDQSDICLGKSCSLYFGGDLGTATVAVGSTTVTAPTSPTTWEIPLLAKFSTAPVPTVSVSGNFTVCAGKSSTLTASGAATYSWANGTGTATFAVTPSVTTIYTVAGYGANGCEDSKNVMVTVNPLPTLTVTGYQAPLCKGQTATLTSTGTGTLAWSAGGSSSPTLTVTPATNTVITVTLTNTLTGCSATAAAQLTVDACVHIKEITLQQVQVFPNPATDIVFVKFNDHFSSELKIYNLVGEMVLQHAASEQPIYIGSLPTGVYFLEANSDGFTAVIKLIKI